MQNMPYTIREPTPEEFPKITEFLDQNFHLASKDKHAAIKWRYSSSSLHHPIIRISVDDHNNICSHYANIPYPICYMAKIYDSLLCTDMATDAKHRGEGLITATAKEVYREVETLGSDFTIGYSNKLSIKVDKYSKQYGYQIVGKFCTYVGIPILSKKTRYTINIGQQELVDLHNDNDKNHFYKVHKSTAYLHWRYLNKPEHKYIIFELQSEQRLAGYVVTLSKGGYFYVMDIILRDLDAGNLEMAAAAIHNYCVQQNIRAVIYHVLQNKIWDKVCVSLRYVKKPFFATERYLTIKFHKQQIPKMLDVNNWLIMNGDII